MINTIQLEGFAISLSIFIIIKVFIIRGDREFRDFFVGDDGRYSLSRVQAMVWAYVINSFQVSAMITMISIGEFSQYRMVFSENILWLQGLSLGSYVIVKGISVNQVAKTKQAERVAKPRLADLVSGENGLDFSKFQMLVWTIIAIGVYVGKCHIYFAELKNSLDQTGATLADMFDPAKTFLPTVDSGFIVLMGISQGAYIGKKLIPSFKVADVRNSNIADLEKQVKDLTTDVEGARKVVQEIDPSMNGNGEQKQKLEKELQEKEAALLEMTTELATLKSAPQT